MDDLVGDGGRRLRFDFGVLKQDNTLDFLIEYDGIYHHKTMRNHDETHLAKQQRYDSLKDEYCKFHNIELIRISCMDADSNSPKKLFKNIEEKLK